MDCIYAKTAEDGGLELTYKLIINKPSNAVVLTKHDAFKCKNYVSTTENGLAGEEGLEPSHTDPESAVLPLDDSPTNFIEKASL